MRTLRHPNPEVRAAVRRLLFLGITGPARPGHRSTTAPEQWADFQDAMEQARSELRRAIAQQTAGGTQ